MITKPIEYAIQRREALRRETEFLEGVIAALQEVHRLSEQVRQLSEWAKSAGFAERIAQEHSAVRDSLAHDVVVKNEICERVNALNASVEATLANLVNSSTSKWDASMRDALKNCTSNIDGLMDRVSSSNDTWKHVQEILQRQREQQERFFNLSFSDIFHGSQRPTLRDRIVSEARAILADGKPRGTKELLEHLEQRGVRINGNQQIANLSAYLSKADEFVSDRSRGGWMLRQQWLKALTGEKKETPQEDAGSENKI